MCGDDEEDLTRLDDEMFERFLKAAGRHGVTRGAPGANSPSGLRDQRARAAYLEGLFQAALRRAVNDAGNLEAGERMDALAGQAIVFARLAGFLAGQFPPEANLFQSVVTALMEGQKETSGLG